jgi:hypothetical protein
MITFNAIARFGALAALLALTGACSDVKMPTAPAPVHSQQVPALEPLPPLPPISRPARVFEFVPSPAHPTSAITETSRYVLYDDGTFALQFNGVFEYLGTYTEADGVIQFFWEGRSVAGPWGANGTLDGNTLTVRYNIIMQLSDFEDCAYRLDSVVR